MRILAVSLMLLGGRVASIAKPVTFELGPFGEIRTWLVGYAPSATPEKDPLESIGGETRFAAMTDGKLAPVGGQTLELSGPSGAKVQVPWQIGKMVGPQRPNIMARHSCLNVLLGKDGRGVGGVAYCYCRMISPRDMAGSLIGGIAAFTKGRFYLNGKDLGYVPSTWLGEGEDIVEMPLQLKQGVNHLLVRVDGVASLSCRLVGVNAEPLREVKIEIDAVDGAPVAPTAPAPDPEHTLTRLAARNPPVPPLEHPELLGAKLGRTMALLDSGRYTHRPVRIMFYGQSIESGWPDLLIQRLRERYPGTPIVYDNRAIGGWFAWRLMKTLKHDVLRWQPDLVLFHAYQGSAETWERFLSDLRRETTADIVIRTSHLCYDDSPEASPETAEASMLRRLAQQYGVELVEVRSEWTHYVKTHKLDHNVLLADGIHLNEKGSALMAGLYERHFRYNPLASQGWANMVRRYDVMRFLEEDQTDEIVLNGQAWLATGRGYAQSESARTALTLRFVGTRIDLVLPPGRGGAAILIDGKKPSAWGLFHGTIPWPRTRSQSGNLPELLMTYHMGEAMQEETWCLTFTQTTTNKLHSRFTLVGSKTGTDGDGDTDHDFVSTSGRIIIKTGDWWKAGERANAAAQAGATPPTWQPARVPAQIVWHIQRDSMDTVFCTPELPPNSVFYSGLPFRYVTIFDGLPCGPHELTLTPLDKPGEPFVVMGADVHHPPMANERKERTE